MSWLSSKAQRRQRKDTAQRGEMDSVGWCLQPPPTRAWSSPSCWAAGPRRALAQAPVGRSPHKAWVVLLAGLGLPATEGLAGAACPRSLPSQLEAPDLSECQYLMRSSFESMQSTREQGDMLIKVIAVL